MDDYLSVLAIAKQENHFREWTLGYEEGAKWARSDYNYENKRKVGYEDIDEDIQEPPFITGFLYGYSETIDNLKRDNYV